MAGKEHDMLSVEFKDRAHFARWYMNTVLELVQQHHSDAFYDISTMMSHVRDIHSPGNGLKKFTIFFRPQGCDLFIDGKDTPDRKELFLNNNDYAYDIDWVWGGNGYESIYVTQIK